MAKESNWLSVRQQNITSEHGEDGVIEAIFEVLGEGSKWCVELGALNGTHGSNTWNLLQNKNWHGVLIEADPTYYSQLYEHYGEHARVTPVNAFVSFEGEHSLDAVLARTSIPPSFDLLSLDIDGNDYHVWDSLTHYRPRVVVIEFNPSIPNDITFIQPRDMNVFQGSSLRAFIELAKQKGYELITTTAANAFFVERELFNKFEIDDNSIDTLHTDRSYQTILFQLFDGTLQIRGYSKLMWHNMPIDVEKLQVLSRRQRKYPARISQHGSVRRSKEWVRKLPFYQFLIDVKRFFGF